MQVNNPTSTKNMTTQSITNSINRSPWRRAFLLIPLVLVCAAAYGPAPVASAQGITFTPATPMHKARGFFVATELLNGNILVAGGYDGSCNCAPNFADSEIYNWRTGLWTLTSPMNAARAAPVAVRLENGRVMVIGGFGEIFDVLNSAEIYNPGTATWSLTAPMNDARVEDFTAVLLPGRRVLVAGARQRSTTSRKRAC